MGNLLPTAAVDWNFRPNCRLRYCGPSAETISFTFRPHNASRRTLCADGRCCTNLTP